MTQVTLYFSVSGYVAQTIELTDPSYTAEQVISGLNAGTLVTTVQESGTVDVTGDGRVVARVVNVNNALEYEDFSLRGSC